MKAAEEGRAGRRAGRSYCSPDDQTDEPRAVVAPGRDGRRRRRRARLAATGADAVVVARDTCVAAWGFRAQLLRFSFFLGEGETPWLWREAEPSGLADGRPDHGVLSPCTGRLAGVLFAWHSSQYLCIASSGGAP